MNRLYGVLGLCAFLAGCGGGSGSGGGTFSAEVVSIIPVNPATVTVIATVTNTGISADTPSCTVRVQDTGGSYSGFDSVSLVEPVSPGDTTKFKVDLVVTNEGAAYADQGTVECK